MGNLVFGSGVEPGRASKARGGLTESPMERDYDTTESDRERHNGALRVGPEFSRPNVRPEICPGIMVSLLYWCRIRLKQEFGRPNRFLG